MARLLCPGPVTRREFIQVGALALGGLSLPQILAARAAAGESRRDTSVILLFLHGGPSHLETYDLKPDAPSEYRSVFGPISTKVPGMDVCELLPMQAQVADRFSLIRSLNHDISIHTDGAILVFTGKRPSRLDPTSTSVSEHPDFGSVASYVRSGTSGNVMPPYVAIPSKLKMTQPTYLGVRHSAFDVGDPSDAKYAPPHLTLAPGRGGQALEDRRSLLRQLDRMRSGLDLAGTLKGTEEFRNLALAMLTSPQVAVAFDIAREKDKLRDRYGRNPWGQGCLLARRLAEAGTAVVSLFLNTPCDGPEFTNWDDHIENSGRLGHFARYMAARLPYYDQALAALIEDVHARGLDQKIMIVAVGEFGRTPRLSFNPRGVGRDHWPQAFTALVSGGGLKMGQVVGATNIKGEYPTEQPHSPYDLLATIYRHLGIDYRQTLTDFSGRPIHILSEGEPIQELI